MIKVRKVYTFAYGSNLWKAQMQRRCPSSRPVVDWYIEGYLLRFAGTCSVVKSDRSNARTYGAIYEMNSYDIHVLDRYEGVASRIYNQITLPTSITGFDYPLITYVKTYQVHDYPRHEYLERVYRGYHDWELPTQKIRQALKRCDMHHLAMRKDLIASMRRYEEQDYDSFEVHPADDWKVTANEMRVRAAENRIRLIEAAKPTSKQDDIYPQFSTEPGWMKELDEYIPKS